MLPVRFVVEYSIVLKVVPHEEPSSLIPLGNLSTQGLVGKSLGFGS